MTPLQIGCDWAQHCEQQDHSQLSFSMVIRMATVNAHTKMKQLPLGYQKRRHMSRKLNKMDMVWFLTTQIPNVPVKAMEVIIITVLTMIPTTIGLMLITIKVPLHVIVSDQVILRRMMHHRFPEKQLSTNNISAMKMTNPATWRPWPTIISEKKICSGRIAAWQCTCSVTAVRDSSGADYSMTGINIQRHVPYRPLITVSLFLISLLCSYWICKLWRSC